MDIFNRAVNFIHSLFCSHKRNITKTENHRLFAECLDCGHQSRGVHTSVMVSQTFASLEDALRLTPAESNQFILDSEAARG